jgi:hypothetical protein
MRKDEGQKDLCAPAEQLVTLAREELGEMSARGRAEGLLKLNARRSAATRPIRRVLTVPVVLTLAAFALIGSHWMSLRQARALSYTVEGGRIDPTGIVEANGKADPTLRFSDGTEIVFLAGARGRVKSVGEHDARIALSGKVNVAVVPRRGSHWLFDAGPFLITVTGTAFTAEWQDAEGRLEVALKTGAVSVTGPLSDEAIVLRAGQRLIVSMREKEVLIRSIDSSKDARVAASDQPAPPAGGSVDSPSPRSEMSPSGPPVHASATSVGPSAPSVPPVASNWTTDLAAGRFAIILRQAEERGLDTVMAEVSSDELAVLADAARYSRREDVARRALAAQRRRFPGSARANDAAFLMGRLEETAQHLELALGWYERCLDESPNGTYTSEALGRKMTAVRRLHGAARARPVAEEYLRRFGNGTYAAAARALTRAQ